MVSPMAAEELVDAMLAQPSPALFLDTASILDILRVPFRKELQVDIIESAASFVDDALADPRRVWLVTSDNVIQELGRHRINVADELRQSIARVSTLAKTVLPERRIGSLDLPEAMLEERILGIMDRMVESMTVFRCSETCTI